MRNKDVIVRVDSSSQEATTFLNELQKEAQKHGLIAEPPIIRLVPGKVEKSKIQDRKAKDIKLAVSNLENKVDNVIQAITDAVEKELSLLPSSVHIKLETDKNDSDK